MAAKTTSFVKIVKQGPMGPYKMVEAQIDGPGNYDSTNNHIVTAKQLGLGRIHGYVITNAVTKSTGVGSNNLCAVPGPPAAADSDSQGFGSIVIVWFDAIASVTEVANDTDLTTKQLRIMAWGDDGGAY